VNPENVSTVHNNMFVGVTNTSLVGAHPTTSSTLTPKSTSLDNDLVVEIAQRRNITETWLFDIILATPVGAVIRIYKVTGGSR